MSVSLIGSNSHPLQYWTQWTQFSSLHDDSVWIFHLPGLRDLLCSSQEKCFPFYKAQGCEWASAKNPFLGTHLVALEMPMGALLITGVILFCASKLEPVSEPSAKKQPRITCSHSYCKASPVRSTSASPLHKAMEVMPPSNPEPLPLQMMSHLSLFWHHRVLADINPVPMSGVLVGSCRCSSIGGSGWHQSCSGIRDSGSCHTCSCSSNNGPGSCHTGSCVRGPGCQTCSCFHVRSHV